MMSTSLEGILSVDSTRRNPEEGKRRIRAVNVLCLCGAVIGIASVFCTWSFLVSSGEIIASESLVERLDPFSSNLWFAGSAIFLVGTVVALFTTLSGFVQFAGIVVYVAAIRDRTAELEGVPASDFSFGIGLGLMMGVVSASAVLFSVFLPAGPGLRTAPATLLDRLLVFRRGAASRVGSAAAKAEAAERAKAFFRSQGKWVSFIVATSLVSAGLVSVDGGLYPTDPLLEQVGGGIEIDVNSFAVVAFGLACDWSEHTLRLSDEQASIEWVLASEELSNGSWCAVDFGSRVLGSLVVSLTVIDQSGDGRFGSGDSLVVVAQNGTAFAEDVAYGLEWTETGPPPTIPPSGSYSVSVTFVIYEGSIDSWSMMDVPGFRL